jgi:hypothetical protein
MLGDFAVDAGASCAGVLVGLVTIKLTLGERATASR